MSRSYHRSNFRQDKSFKNHTYKYRRDSKTEANHRVRQYNKNKLSLALKTDIDMLSLPQNNDYKHIYDSYEISDYRAHWNPSFEDIIPRYKWFAK